MPGDEASLTLIKSTVSDNMAVSDGVGFNIAVGGIQGAPITLNKSMVSGNSAEATSSGGAVLAAGGLGTGGLVVLEKSTLTDNTAVATNTAAGVENFAGAAGAIGTLTGADIALHKSTLSENTSVANAPLSVAIASGGIGLAESVSVSSTKSDIVENHATAVALPFAVSGGAMNMELNSSVTLTKSRVNENRADGSGFATGGISNRSGTLVLEDSELEENHASSTGAPFFVVVVTGGIATGLGGASETTLIRSEVEENVAVAPDADVATGGLHLFKMPIPGAVGTGMISILDDSEVEDNEPINCNFFDPACDD